MAPIDKAYALKDNPFTLESSLSLDIPNQLRDLLGSASERINADSMRCSRASEQKLHFHRDQPASLITASISP